MLSLQLPGKGVRVTVGEIHCTQSCPRKAQKTKKKRKERRIFFSSRDRRGRILLLEREVLHTENIADAQVHLKEQSEQDMRGPR